MATVLFSPAAFTRYSTATVWSPRLYLISPVVCERCRSNCFCARFGQHTSLRRDRGKPLQDLRLRLAGHPMQFQTTEPPDRNWQSMAPIGHAGEKSAMRSGTSCACVHQLATLANNRQSDPERVVLVCFYLVEAQPMQKTLKALTVDAYA